jgi:hypothetical protein
MSSHSLNAHSLKRIPTKPQHGGHLMFQLLTATLLIAQMSFSQHPSESTPAQEMRVALLEEGFTSKQVEILFSK